MSQVGGIKPSIPVAEVLQLLREYFGDSIRDLEPAPGGNVAQTFSFSAEPECGTGNSDMSLRRDYIVRFNAPMLLNYEKDAYVYENFASEAIPIPRVLHIGRLGDVHFAISEKAPGRNLLEIPRAEYLALIPELIRILDAIHRVPLEERPGHGVFDGNGVGLWPSWRSHLECVNAEEPPGDFYGKWYSLFETSFLERNFFERLYDRMELLMHACPEERYLVHGGCGLGNILTANGKITAVLDWMEARYGDFLFDVAWLDFWSPEDRGRERFEEHYSHVGRAVPHYRERILCYQCYGALDGLRFLAKKGDRSGYDYVKQRILTLLHDS